MSITGMNELALDRAEAIEEHRSVPATRRRASRTRAYRDRSRARRPGPEGREEAPAEPATRPEPVDDTEDERTGAAKALEEITRYIPTEALTIYLALLGLIGVTSGDFTGRWIAFAIFAVATPGMVLVDWLILRRRDRQAKTKAGKKLLYFNAAAATIAFVAWAFALPATPFAEFDFYDPKWGGFAALVVSYGLTKSEALFLPAKT